jgi:hypothetical protein
MHRWFFPKYPLTTLLGPTYRSPMVFPTCSPTPYVTSTSTPTPTKFKCTFCYRTNVNHIVSLGQSFCDDDCRQWWKDEEQKRMRQEYLELQGMSYLLRWPHRGIPVNLLTIDIPPPPHPDRCFRGQKQGGPHRGVSHFLLLNRGSWHPSPPRWVAHATLWKFYGGFIYTLCVWFASDLRLICVCAYTIGGVFVAYFL